MSSSCALIEFFIEFFICLNVIFDLQCVIYLTRGVLKMETRFKKESFLGNLLNTYRAERDANYNRHVIFRPYLFKCSSKFTGFSHYQSVWEFRKGLQAPFAILILHVSATSMKAIEALRSISMALLEFCTGNLHWTLAFAREGIMSALLGAIHVVGGILETLKATLLFATKTLSSILYLFKPAFVAGSSFFEVKNSEKHSVRSSHTASTPTGQGTNNLFPSLDRAPKRVTESGADYSLNDEAEPRFNTRRVSFTS